MEKVTKRKSWIFEKPSKASCFSLVFEGPADSFCLTLGLFLGSYWVSLGGLVGFLGGLVAVLEASWLCLGMLGNAEGCLTMLACVWEQDQDFRTHGHVRATIRFGERGGRYSRPGKLRE